MSSVDNRIVNMQFNNAGFESGVKTTLNSLKNLNESLKMKNASQGLNEVDKSLRNLGGNSLSGISDGVATVTAKFSALGVIATTALVNITNTAMNAGKNLAKSFTIDPILDGFGEYELKMNSIQTILTNTEKHGTNLKQVNAALNELNEYSDKTIYNFAQMTDNIGKATAAGLTLKDSITFVKGMSNAAAGFGVDATRMAGATYQMTQALSAGVIKLMDWKSLEQAGMGGQRMQDEMIAAAEGMGIFVDKSKPFRESLNDGWLTSEVFIAAMNKMANDPSLLAAAQNVTSFTKLLGTMKEQIGSGWAQSFEYIFGNKDQSTKLWTDISNAFGELVSKSAEARNEVLKFWNETGGRDAVIKGLENIIGSLGKALGAVGKAWKEVFPSITGKQLVALSKSFKDLTEKFKMSDKTAKMIKDTFKGLFSILNIGKEAVVSFIKAFAPAGSIFATLGSGILKITSAIGGLFTSINNSIKASGIFDKFVTGVNNGIKSIGNFFTDAIKGIENFFAALSSLNFKPIFDFIGSVGSGVGDGISKVFEGIGKTIGSINFNTIFGVIGTLAAGKGLGTIKSIATSVKDSFESLSDVTESAGKIGSVLDGVKESLESYQNSLNAGILLKIAGAIGILALSLGMLSDLDEQGLQNGLTGITMLFIELVAGMAALLKVASKTTIKGFFSISTALVTFSIGIGILAMAMKNISGIEWDKAAIGLGSIAAMIAMMVKVTKTIERKSDGMIKAAAALVIFASSIKILAGAVKTLSSIDVEGLVKGLSGVAVLMAEMSLFVKYTDLSELSFKNAVGLIALATSLNIMATAVDKFSSIDTDSIIQGLLGVGAALGGMSAFISLTKKADKVMSTSLGMIALATSLHIMAAAVKSFADMEWADIEKGMVALIGGLGVLGGALNLIPSTKVVSSAASIVLMSGAIVILSGALRILSNMSFEKLSGGVQILAAALLVLGTAMTFMSKTVAGAAAMVIMSGALALLVPQFIALSKLNLTQMQIGIIGLAGVFLVLGGAGMALAPLLPALAGLAGVVALLGLACTAAGLGVAMFAAGLGTLAAVGAGGGLALIEILRQIINLLPSLGQKLAEAFTNFIVQLGSGVPLMVEGFGQIISGILQAFTEAIPKIANAATDLVVAICNTIADAVPQLVTAGVNMILALLDGISSNIERLTTQAIDIIVKFVNTIAANTGRIIQAGINLAISLINGLANGIRNNSGAVTAACLNLISACIGAIGGAIGQFLSKGMEAAGKLVSGIKNGIGKCLSAGRELVQNAINGAKEKIGDMITVGTNLVKGLTQGIKNAASGVISAAKGVVKNAIDGAKKLLGIHSPSRVFAEIGKFTVMGFSKGLNDNVEMSGDSARELAKDAINNMSKPLKRVSDIINGTIDATPTITPVMNLDAIKKGNRALKAMMASNEKIELGGTMTSGVLTKNIKGVQNGNSNSDVVSELKSLRKRIDNIQGNTTIVNGITYDDGSNVASAVESLVHAARIERRV